MKTIYAATLSLLLTLLPAAWGANDEFESDTPPLPTSPFLRINTEMHVAQIKRFTIDAGETLMATSSDDKNVKLWDLKTGQFIRTFRVPIGSDNVGKTYSVALSPDGSILAVSGLTGGPIEGQQVLYVFDVKTGDLITQVRDLRSAVEHLEFSPKGDYLVAGYTSFGISLFETETWQIISDDDSYDRGIWIDWDTSASTPRFAVAGFADGYVRVYEVIQGQLNLILKKDHLARGYQPFCVEYHPDGDLLAVGYADNTNIDVLDANSLNLLYSVDTSDISGGDLASVAWSKDGKSLIAGGRYNAEKYDWLHPVFKWADRGKGARDEWLGIPHTIQQLSTLSGGRTLIAGSGPYWAMLGPDGERVKNADGEAIDWAPEVADFRSSGEGLMVTEDRMSVCFPLDGYDGDYHHFRVEDLFYTSVGENIPVEYYYPDNTSIDVQGWKSGEQPTLNGQPLTLEAYETPRTFAVAPDGQSFLLGTSWNLRRYDRSGNLIWRFSAPSINWAANVSPDGRFAVAAFSDGTIRWIRYSDGQELLAVFPHANGQDFIAWTPEGYYKASPDGERLIGWHVNRALGENPDFYSADQLFELFSDENGILQQVLKESRTATEIVNDLVLAGEMQRPPSVEEALYGVPEVQFLKGPADLTASSTEWIDVTIAAVPTADDVGVRRIELTNNGKRVAESGPLLERQGVPTQKFSVRLAKGRNELRAVAYSDRRTASFPAVTRVRFDGVRATSDLWVFGVGLEEYQNPKYKLSFCRKDVEETANALKTRGASIFDDEYFVFLPDSEATRLTIEDKFKELATQVKPEDTFVFIYAGHGTMSEATADREAEFFLVPYDVTRLYGDDEQLMEKALPARGLVELLSEVPAQKQVMVLDACHSGAITSVMAMAARGAAEEKAIAQLSRATGTAVLASSGAEQFSRGHPELEHGFFSYAFLKGLKDGEADANEDGSITINELNQYLNDRVPELTVEYGKPPQYPQSYYRGADFPIGFIGR